MYRWYHDNVWDVQGVGRACKAYRQLIVRFEYHVVMPCHHILLVHGAVRSLPILPLNTKLITVQPVVLSKPLLA